MILSFSLVNAALVAGLKRRHGEIYVLSHTDLAGYTLAWVAECGRTRCSRWRLSWLAVRKVGGKVERDRTSNPVIAQRRLTAGLVE
jgi:hypothetical protein